ncbi:MAG: HTTM domain-containing protein [Myxococcales bacterium]|nr:HTTM domain-containing protein [Myxococcales bacterium]MCB9646063.1 HTTM domain-containing protein [Deltaproteobacteria bacterium]
MRLRFNEGWLAERPETLALFRVVVPSVVLTSPLTWSAWSAAQTPRALWVPPLGTAWALDVLPVGPAPVAVALVLLTAGCVLGAVGLHTRVSLAVATVAALYVLGLPQLSGSVVHDHHLVWFLALLAASPSGDVWSIDAARARRRYTPARSVAYGIPVWAARVLVGIIFFFPGLWKLRASGWAWIASDNLQHLLHRKWLEAGVLDPIRIDHVPGLLFALALAAVVFELGFILCLPFRRPRRLAVWAALGFHAFTAIFLEIHFSALWLCYVVFLEPAGLGWRWFGRVHLRRARPLTRRAWLPAAAVAAVLVVGNGVMGTLGRTQAWPLACYPTFQDLATDRILGLWIEVHRPGGAVVVLRRGDEGGSSRSWARQWALIRGPRTPTRYAAFVASDPALARAAAGAQHVVFAAVWHAVAPEARGGPPLASEPLLTLTWPTGASPQTDPEAPAVFHERPAAP